MPEGPCGIVMGVPQETHHDPVKAPSSRIPLLHLVVCVDRKRCEERLILDCAQGTRYCVLVGCERHRAGVYVL